MTVYKNNRDKWCIDIDDFVHPDGRKEPRIRKTSPVQTERGAERYEREVRRALQDGTYGKYAANAEVPTVAVYSEHYLEVCKAEKRKPTGLLNTEGLINKHILPLFGGCKVNEFGKKEQSDLLKHFGQLSPSRYNNAASAINGILAMWHEENEKPGEPFRFKRLDVPDPIKPFYDFEQVTALVAAAQSEPIVKRFGLTAELACLLGADAGLRRGEMWALMRDRCRMRERQLIIERSETLSGKKRFMAETKGKETRIVPMTARLHDALSRAMKSSKSERLLLRPKGDLFLQGTWRNMMATVQAAAGLEPTGETHILRHTFCSHLAIRGVPVKTIQELAGHKQLSTTLGYMRLAVGNMRTAIAALEQPPPK